MGTVNLKTASGGSVILSPANTAVDVTITVPASNATMLTTATAGVPINGPCFSAWQSAVQTIPSATPTKVLFQTKDFDTNTCYDTTLSRFTPTVAGYYQIISSFNVPAASRASEIQIYIYKNGGLWKSGNDQTATTYNLQTTCLVYCNGSTDYIETYVYIGIGATTVAYQVYTFFQAAMVRSA